MAATGCTYNDSRVFRGRRRTSGDVGGAQEVSHGSLSIYERGARGSRLVSGVQPIAGFVDTHSSFGLARPVEP